MWSFKNNMEKRLKIVEEIVENLAMEQYLAERKKK
jgi:hypothetical protein